MAASPGVTLSAVGSSVQPRLPAWRRTWPLRRQSRASPRPLPGRVVYVCQFPPLPPYTGGMVCLSLLSCILVHLRFSSLVIYARIFSNGLLV